MDILILTFYYPPDMSAGSFRAKAMVDALRECMNDGDRLDVMTSTPNRYASYSVSAPLVEQQDMVRIRRFPVPGHGGSMLRQALSYGRYFFQVLKEIRSRNYDIVVATSSRLMTAVLGAVVASRTGARLYLDVRDLFVETMEDVARKLPIRLIFPFIRVLERYAFRSADRINIVSEGFRPYLTRFFPSTSIVNFTNGIDPEFLQADYHARTLRGRPRVVYAGNIGEGQGLHKIIPSAARMLENECEFLIVGDGGMREALLESIRCSGVSNVKVMNPVSRDRLIEIYAEADVLFLHLNDYGAFKRVLPSKIFEYAATGKPILAGVDGFARRFLMQHVEGVGIFDPCDADGLVRAFRMLDRKPVQRDAFRRRFDRRSIMRSFAEDILSLI